MAVRSLSLVLAVSLLAASASAQNAPEAPRQYSGNFFGADHDDHGTFTLWGAPDGVLLHVEVKGLKPGWHAMHFHEKGVCEDAAYKSAGGHIHSASPTTHGYYNAGNEPGDLPNIYVGEDGHGYAEVYTDKLTAAKVDGRPYLTDDDGSALVIHALPDDYKSQPIGGAGDRVVCGPVE